MTYATWSAARGPRTGAERRRERRFQVDLPGQVQHAGRVLDVRVSDLSASGALVTAEGIGEGCGSGDRIMLLLDQLAPIDARFVHVGRDFCGVQFLHPHQHRDQLAEWLRGEPAAR